MCLLSQLSNFISFIYLFIYPFSLVNSMYFLKKMALTAMNNTVNQYVFSITQRVADVRLYVSKNLLWNGNDLLLSTALSRLCCTHKLQFA